MTGDKGATESDGGVVTACGMDRVKVAIDPRDGCGDGWQPGPRRLPPDTGELVVGLCGRREASLILPGCEIAQTPGG